MTAKGGNFAAPADQGAAVTPSDTVNLTTQSRALYVGGAGNVSVVMGGPDANVLTFIAVPAGALLPLIVSRVNATLTTATNIVAVY